MEQLPLQGYKLDGSPIALNILKNLRCEVWLLTSDAHTLYVLLGRPEPSDSVSLPRFAHSTNAWLK